MSAVATGERLGYAPGEMADGPALERPAPRLFDAPGPTLEDRIVGLWDELVASGRVRCPVCNGSLHIVGGCEDCGSELS